MWGRVSAPTGCSPRDSGRLLSSRVGSSLTISYCSSSSFDFAAANASLRAQLGESQTALRAKDAKLAALVQERDRLVKKLADQEEGHKAALKAAQDHEAALQAEFETEAAGWAEARQTLVSGYGQIEDLVDGKPPTSPSFLAICHFGLFSDFGVPFFLSSSSRRVFPWLFDCRQPDHRGPSPSAEASRL